MREGIRLAAKKKNEVAVTRVRKVEPPSDGTGKKSEIAGVCWIALGLFLFVCVISPSASHWIGKAGYLLQQLLFGLFGMASYALPIALIALGVICIAQTTGRVRTAKITGGVFGVFFILCLLNMIFLKKVNS